MYLIFLTKPGEQENRIFMAWMSHKERLTALQSQFSNILRTCGIFSTMTYPVNHDRIVSVFNIQPNDYDLMMFNEAVGSFLGFGEGLECQNLYWNMCIHRFFEFRSRSNQGPRRPGFDFNHQFPEDFSQFLGKKKSRSDCKSPSKTRLFRKIVLLFHEAQSEVFPVFNCVYWDKTLWFHQPTCFPRRPTPWCAIFHRWWFPITIHYTLW